MNENVEEILVEENMTEQSPPETETVEEIIADEANATDPVPEQSVKIHSPLSFDDPMCAEALIKYVDYRRSGSFYQALLKFSKKRTHELETVKENTFQKAALFKQVIMSLQPREKTELFDVPEEISVLYDQVEPHTRGNALKTALKDCARHLASIGWNITWNANGLAEGEEPREFMATKMAHTFVLNRNGSVIAFTNVANVTDGGSEIRQVPLRFNSDTWEALDYVKLFAMRAVYERDKEYGTTESPEYRNIL